jgi:asparaginyl-tRNA synthetase
VYNTLIVDKRATETLLGMRRLAKRAITDSFDARDFLEATSTSITLLTGACETVSTLFGLPYFEHKVHLAQTAQLQLEMLVKLMERPVWTFDHSFRAEPRVDSRHLTEFCLLELEAPGFELGQIMSTQEALLQECIQSMVRERNGIASPFVKRIDFLTSINFPLQVVDYQAAVQLLASLGRPINSGQDIGTDEEQALLGHFRNAPFFLTRHPDRIKYFNMKRTDDNAFVLSADLIAPPFGEISGGAEREDNLDRLKNNLYSSEMWEDIKRAGLDQQEFDWYLALWNDGSPGPRGGFGLGFERLIGFLTGFEDIRMCIEFPRNRACVSP